MYRLDKNRKCLLQGQCSVSDTAVIIFGALCQQGSAVTPVSVTGKMIMVLSFITLMFLFVSYSATIVALLQAPSNQITTLQDLYDTKLDFSIVDTVYNRHYFAVSSSITKCVRNSNLHWKLLFRRKANLFERNFMKSNCRIKMESQNSIHWRTASRTLERWFNLANLSKCLNYRTPFESRYIL